MTRSSGTLLLPEYCRLPPTQGALRPIIPPASAQRLWYPSSNSRQERSCGSFFNFMFVLIKPLDSIKNHQQFVFAALLVFSQKLIWFASWSFLVYQGIVEDSAHTVDNSFMYQGDRPSFAELIRSRARAYLLSVIVISFLIVYVRVFTPKRMPI